MSNLTGTSVELLYASIATGTQLANFTTEDSLQKTLAPVIIPAGYFYNPAAASKSLTVRARLRMSSGATGRGFTFSARLLTSTTWSAGGILLGSSGSLTMANSQTLAPVVLNLDITARAISVGGASTLATMGDVEGPLAFASPFGGTIPANNTAFTVTTVDNSTTYYLFLSCACSVAGASDLIQCEMLKVYGEN